MSGAGKEVGRISIKVTPDTDGFRKDLERALKRIEKEVRGVVPVEVDLDTLKARGDMQGLMAKLKTEAARGVTVDVKTKIDQSQVAQIRQLSTGLSSLGGSAESASEGMSGLGRTGTLVAAGFAAAAPAVGLVAGLLAGLPALISVAGAGITTLIVGFQGFGDAITAIGDGDLEKFNKALEKLSPNAASAAQALKGLMDGPFKAFQQSIQDSLFQGINTQIEKFGTLLPSLTPGFNAVATGLNSMANGFFDVIASSKGMSQIQNILSQTGSFFDKLSPILGTATNSFLTLANAGSNSLGLIIAPLQQFATQFDNIVTRITSNGSFEGAMQGLSSVLGSVTNLFGRLFESGVTAMGQLGGPLTTLINGLGDAFIAAMPALTSFSGAIATVLGTALTAIAPAITALTPAFTQFANIISTGLVANLQTLSPVLTTLATTLGTSLTTAMTQLQPMLPGLVTSFGQFATSLTTGLAPVLPQLATSFGTLAASLLQISPTILQTMADAFVQLAPQIPPIASAFAAFLAAVTPLVPQIANLAVQAIKLAPAFLSAVPSVLAIVGGLTTLVSTVISAAGEVASFAGKVVSEMASLPGKVVSALGDVGSLLFSSGKAIVQGFINGIKSMFGAVADAASGLMSAVKNFFPHSPAPEGPFSGSGWTAVSKSGAAIGQQFADGLGGQQGTVIDTVKQLMQAVKDVFGNASGLAINFNLGGAGGVTGGPLGGLSTAMSSAATSASDMSTSLNTSLKTTGQITDQTKMQAADLTQQIAQLELQRKQLAIQKDQAGDKGMKGQLQSQIDAINLQKKQLDLQKSQLTYNDKYNGGLEESNNLFSGMDKKMTDIATNFAKANIGQLQSDLNIGGGAITGGLQAGLDWGTQFASQFVFNVSNTDDAIAVKNNQLNKQSMQYQGR